MSLCGHDQIVYQLLIAIAHRIPKIFPIEGVSLLTSLMQITNFNIQAPTFTALYILACEFPSSWDHNDAGDPPVNTYASFDGAPDVDSHPGCLVDAVERTRLESTYTFIIRNARSEICELMDEEAHSTDGCDLSELSRNLAGIILQYNRFIPPATSPPPQSLWWCQVDMLRACARVLRNNRDPIDWTWRTF